MASLEDWDQWIKEIPANGTITLERPPGRPILTVYHNIEDIIGNCFIVRVPKKTQNIALTDLRLIRKILGRPPIAERPVPVNSQTPIATELLWANHDLRDIS